MDQTELVAPEPPEPRMKADRAGKATREAYVVTYGLTVVFVRAWSEDDARARVVSRFAFTVRPDEVRVRRATAVDVGLPDTFGATGTTVEIAEWKHAAKHQQEA